LEDLPQLLSKLGVSVIPLVMTLAFVFLVDRQLKKEQALHLVAQNYQPSSNVLTVKRQIFSCLYMAFYYSLEIAFFKFLLASDLPFVQNGSSKYWP